MELVASFFINTYTVYFVFIAIFVFAYVQFRAFANKINPLIEEFKVVNIKLSTCGCSKSKFCAFYDNEFDTYMNKTNYLKNSWREFNETLLIPHLDFTPKAGEEKILNTHHTSTYFNQRYILWSKVNMRWFNALPNILTGLGIVGTFIGLVSGIYIASPGLSADSIQAAKGALNVLLSGASLAFLTSIAGLVSSMLFSHAEKKKIHEFDKLCQTFVSEIDERVEYFSSERLSNKVLQESIKQSFALETFANDLAVTMGKIMQEQIATPMITAINELTEKQSSANDETIEKVMKEFAASISGAAGEEMKSLAATIETISKKLEEQLAALSESHKAMNESATFIMNEMTSVAENSTIKIGGLNNELGNAVEAQKGLNESNSELHERVKETIFTAGNVVEQSKDLIENIGTTVDKQNTMMEHSFELAEKFTKVSASVEKTHELIASTQEQVKLAWQDYQNRFTSVDESLGKIFNNLNDGMSQYARSTNEYLIGLDMHAAKVVKELAIASKEISDSVEAIGDGLDQQRIDFVSQIAKAKNAEQKSITK
jgi:hypothetical protein